MDLTAVLSGGGVAALLMAFAYVGKMVLDFWKTPSRARQRQTGAVADANVANAILTKSMTTLQAENERLTARVEALEEEKAEHVRKIEELEGRVHQIALELAQLKSS